MSGRPGPVPSSADVIVVGAGLIGLAAAAALVACERRVLLLNETRRGEASVAAAGVLAPSVSPRTGPAQAFALLARDRFPSYVDCLRAETGIDVPLNRLGVLQVALADHEADALRSTLPATSHWLDRAELAELEPALAHAEGAVLHPEDGAINNLVLLRALKAYLGSHARVTVVGDAAVELAFTDHGAPTVVTRGGARHAAPHVVLAAGAWAPTIAGLPRPLPVEPVRGQMLSMAGAPLLHVVFGAGGYLVPRPDGRTLAGATSEQVGFDAGTTEAAIHAVRAAAVAVCPALAQRRLLNAWAGLRPVTPDLLPIIGPDPDRPALIYACGHSRNGVLLAPLTGECVAALVTDARPPAELAPFAVARFAATAPTGA